MNEQRSNWKPGKLGIGFAALDAGAEFYSRRKNNPDENIAVSTLASAGVAAGWLFASPIMWGKTIYDGSHGVGRMVDGARRSSYEMQFQQNEQRGMLGGNFQDTDIGYTTRQRGVQAMQESRLHARNALANEARSLHRL